MREGIERQAAQYVVTISHDPDPATEAAIMQWVAQHPAHGVAFAQAEAAWEATERLKAQCSSRADELGISETGAVPVSPTRGRILVGGALAAASAMGIGSYAWLSRANNYATGIGEVRDFRLADNSVLHLNTDTRVKVALEPHHRLLKLVRGEAYFEVAHDASRPFDVQVPGGVTVRALGTAFNVRIREALVELTVTEGVVGVRTALETVRQVPAGGSAIIQPRTVAVARLDHRVIERRVAWRAHAIVLNGESVAEAVEEFNRYRPAPMVIGDRRVGQLRIGGRFRIDESGLFVEALERTLPVRAVANSDGSILLLYRDDIV